VRDKTQCDQPPVLRGLLYPDPWFGRNLVSPFDLPVFGRPAGIAPRATAWIDGVLNLRPPPQKSSPTVVVPHQVPQYPAVFERKQTGALSAHNDIRGSGSLWDHRYHGVPQLRQESKAAGDVGDPFILLHRSSSSRRGLLGLGRQYQLLGGFLSLELRFSFEAQVQTGSGILMSYEERYVSAAGPVRVMEFVSARG